MAKSQGQQMLEKVAAWMRGYLYMEDPTVTTVIALWTLSTYVYDRLFSFPYLAITASVKGAGKTRVLELLAMTCRSPFATTSPTPAALLRLIKARNGIITILWDEAEVARSEKKDFLSELLNAGYRQGAKIARASGKDEVSEYEVYCAKAFALIGDLNSTVKDRSIVIDMQRGTPDRDYEIETATGEGFEIRAEIEGTIGRLLALAPPMTAPQAWQTGRAREIWGAMFGVAKWLGCDEKLMADLMRTANDLEGAKNREKRSSIDKQAERAAEDMAASAKLLGDAVTCYRDRETWLSSEELLTRLKAIPIAPWRTWRGTGLDALMLSKLLGLYGVGPKARKVTAGQKVKDADGKIRTVGQVVQRGYAREAIETAAKSGGKQ